MDGDKYCWDDPKAERNAKDHGITFDDACRVFEDRNALWDDDLDSSWDEDRYRCTGSVYGRVIVVTHTYRDEDEPDVIRLMSARPAIKREIHDYYRSQTST